MKVLISGGSGFIGSHLVKSLAKDGHDVVVLSRRLGTKDQPKGVRYVTWDARSTDGEWLAEGSGGQAVINLSCASIGRSPWPRQRMAQFLSRRCTPTAALGTALGR